MKNYERGPDAPSEHRLTQRLEEAQGILKVRGIAAGINPSALAEQVGGLLALVLELGLATQEDLDYITFKAKVEAMEGIVLQTTPQPRILRPA